jgi:hypothetical protein
VPSSEPPGIYTLLSESIAVQFLKRVRRPKPFHGQPVGTFDFE